MMTENERRVLDALETFFRGTFVIDHGDDIPAHFAREVLAVIQREGL